MTRTLLTLAFTALLTHGCIGGRDDPKIAKLCPGMARPEHYSLFVLVEDFCDFGSSPGQSYVFFAAPHRDEIGSDGIECDPYTVTPSLDADGQCVYVAESVCRYWDASGVHSRVQASFVLPPERTPEGWVRPPEEMAEAQGVNVQLDITSADGGVKSCALTDEVGQVYAW